jgi:2-keto-4-pentenoate hydratase/2-oxohepta-3-ene-1,7-dioic acid hydratase in catechol pathway
MKPPRWLVGGDTVRIEMTGLGRMSTPVLDEQDAGAGESDGNDA